MTIIPKAPLVYEATSHFIVFFLLLFLVLRTYLLLGFNRLKSHRIFRFWLCVGLSDINFFYAINFLVVFLYYRFIYLFRCFLNLIFFNQSLLILVSIFNFDFLAQILIIIREKLGFFLFPSQFLSVL